MAIRLRFIPDETRYRFMAWRTWSFPFSAVLSVITVVLFFTVGLTFGIDFRGGTLVELQTRAERSDIADVRARANALGFGSVEVQEFGTPRELLMRIELQEGGEAAQQNVVNQLRRTFESTHEFRRVEVVGPRVSAELVQSGMLGVVVAILGVLIYLWFRFEWQFAVGAVIATMHDIVLTIGFMIVMGLTFDMTSIAVVLTILGYSLNDTVVVYDRIRESLRKYKKMGIADVLDASINATLSRTVITGLTTFLAMMALAIFGGEALRGFSYSMLFGVVIGTYSSIFIAAPILIYLGLRIGGDVGTAKLGPVPAGAEAAAGNGASRAARNAKV